jgi:iron complex transport system ATP-binding protein
MLALADVTIARGGRTLLRGVDARFGPGSLTAIVGANGVGKSSLLAAACGALRPTHGTVTLDGRDIFAIDPRTRAREIALVEGTEAVLSTLSVAEAVAGARFPHHRWWEWETTAADVEAVEAALDATALAAYRNRELGTLSAGERQRVWIALALAQRARVIALDEPTSHLDLRYAVETLTLLQRLARAGAIVIAVLHALEEVAGFADRALVLGDGGVIADGTPPEALTTATLERAYGVAIAVEARDGGLVFRRNLARS